MDEVELELFKEIFSYNFMDFLSGFKYLGYFIKVQKTTFEDWRWLLKIFDKRIKHRFNHWLNMGGRCILVKAVLESQANFWMALTAVPTSVLSKI